MRGGPVIGWAVQDSDRSGRWPDRSPALAGVRPMGTALPSTPARPPRCGRRRRRLVAVEVDAERHGGPVGDLVRAQRRGSPGRLVKPDYGVGLKPGPRFLEDAREPRRTGNGEGPPVTRGEPGDVEFAGQRLPGILRRAVRGADDPDDRGSLVPEVAEVEPHDGQNLRPACFEAPELVVPVVEAGDQAVHYAHETPSTLPRLDGPRGGRRRASRAAVSAFVTKPMRWIPDAHRCRRVHLGTRVVAKDTALTLFDVGRVKPG